MRQSDKIIRGLEHRRAFAEFLAVLEPRDVIVIALRLEGLYQHQIAALLGVGRQTLWNWDTELRARIEAHAPDAHAMIQDLQRPTRRPDRSDTFDTGWLGAPDDLDDRAGGPQSPDVPTPPPAKNPN